MRTMQLQDQVLVLGASARLTRLIVADDLGEWWVKAPVDAAMDRYHAAHDWEQEEPWWWRYREGLDCVWCVGFWIGTAVVASHALTKGTRFEKGWRFAATCLTLNYVTATAENLLTRGDPVDDDA